MYKSTDESYMCARTRIPAHMLKRESIPVSGLIGVDTLMWSGACLLMQISSEAAFRGAESVAASLGAGGSIFYQAALQLISFHPFLLPSTPSAHAGMLSAGLTCSKALGHHSA